MLGPDHGANHLLPLQFTIRNPSVQRETTGDARIEAAPLMAKEVLRSPGQPLDAATRAFMEPRFGHDFSRVRVHLDSQAAASAHEVRALAYTLGCDIVFAAGQFAPQTAYGQGLLAHELAHTVQQSSGAGAITTGNLRVGEQNDPYEHDAEKVSASVLSSPAGTSPEQPAAATLRPDRHPALRRQPGPGSDTPKTPPPEKPTHPKGERGGKAPAPGETVCKPPSNIKLPCTPTGLSNDDFLKKGAPQDAFGFTTIQPQQIPHPEVRTKPTSDDKQVVLEPIKATQVACESSYTKAGPAFWRKITLDANKSEQRALAEKCGSSYLSQFRITSDGEKKISEAEMEHCTDYKYAFDTTLGCYEGAVNDLAKKGTPFPDHDHAVEAVTKRVGRKPDTWVDHYIELLEKSAVRDDKKWHTAVMPPGPGLQVEVDRGGRCVTEYPTEINDKSYPQVGKHPTPDVIK